MNTLEFSRDGLEYSEEDHSYKYRGRIVPSVTQVIKDTGIFNLSHIPPHILQAAADRGNETHSVTQAFDLGMYSPNLLTDPIIEQWIQLKNTALEGLVPDAHAVEAYLVNKTHGYAGKIDRVWDLRSSNKTIIIADIKTGMFDEKYCGLQLSGYAEAVKSHISNCIIKTVIIHMKAGTPFSVISINWQNYSSYFFSALNLYHFKRR